MIIRPLSKADASAYREVRKYIYNSKDAQYFSDSFDRERALTEAGWLEWCEEKPHHAILGAFDGDNLVGIVMMTQQGDRASPLAEMEAAWVHPSRRGRLGYNIYEAGLKWAKDHGYDYVIGFVRDTAKTSARLCEGLGFLFAYDIKDELWADGSVGNVNAFVVSLAGNNAAERKARTALDIDAIMIHAQQSLHAPQSRQTELPYVGVENRGMHVA